jgi:hypothetical protein
MSELNELIASRLKDHDRMDKATAESLIAGTKASESTYPYMVRFFVEAAYLAVLQQVKPDLAEAAAKWVQEATEDGETAAEVAHDWRTQLAAGETLWLPRSIIEAL